MCFTNFRPTRGCRSKRVDLGVLIYFIGKGSFLTINFKMLNTLFRVSFDVLLTHQYTFDQQALGSRVPRISVS